MDRMLSILHLRGMREKRNSKRAREEISNKAPQEPVDAMRLWGKNDFRKSFFRLHALVVVHSSAGQSIFCRSRGAVPTPLGGGTISVIKSCKIGTAKGIQMVKFSSFCRTEQRAFKNAREISL